MNEHSRDRNWTIAVDFDGVLHSYTSAWIDFHVIPDPPVEGAIEWLNGIRHHFQIVIFTTRAKTVLGELAVKKWLADHGFELHSDEYDVTALKPPALVYIDDRAWRFEGPGLFPSRQQIHDARPWNKPSKAQIEHAQMLADIDAADEDD